MNGRRALVVQKVAEGKSQKEIAEELGYQSADGVNQALKSMEVREQIQLTRTEMFEAAKIDRVKLLRDLYRKVTCDTSKIFAILQGDGAFLDAANLEKLDELQSRLIQQVDCEPTLVKVPYINDQGESEVQAITVSVVKKIRFHSQDAAMKILAKAAGFEDGVLAFDPDQGGGPFRGLIIIPPGTETIDMERSAEGPPENPI